MLKTVSTQLALASDTLSEILANGNTSGPNNIIMDAGYGINGTLGATTQATVAATTLTSTGGTFTSSGGIPLKVNMASAADNTNIVFQSAGADKWYMRHLGTSGNFSLYNNVRGAEELNIDGATGAATFAGNLVMASGKGIDFSATAGTGTSELLDDYEEGVWSPSVGGDATYHVQDGYYVKVGSLVYVQGKIQINVLGTGSATTVSGLPFTALNAALSSAGTGSSSYFGALATSVTTLVPYVNNATATVIFGSLGAAGVTMTGVTTVFQNSARIDFSLSYRSV
jgi:hypothetical protein